MMKTVELLTFPVVVGVQGWLDRGWCGSRGGWVGSGSSPGVGG